MLKISLLDLFLVFSLFVTACVSSPISTIPVDETNPIIDISEPVDPTVIEEDPLVSDVIHMILSLPERIELVHMENVNDIIDAYNKLDVSQKSQVYNFSTLKLASSNLQLLSAELTEARTFFNLIPGKITLSELELVHQTRQIYEGLTNEQKSLIENFNVLLIAESQISVLLASVKSIENRISELLFPIDYDQEVIIDRILDEYSKLSDEQKARVSNISELIYAQQEMLKIDILVEDLISDIDNLGPIVQWSDYIQVHQVMQRYNQLSDIQKSRITNANALFEMITFFSSHEKTALHIYDSIFKVSTPIHMSQKPILIDIRQQYDALDPELKFLVSNYELFVIYEKTLVKLENEVESVTMLIDKLPDTPRLSDYDEVHFVLNEYNHLGRDQKSAVFNYYKLTSLLKKLDSLETEIIDLDHDIMATNLEIKNLSDRINIEKLSKRYHALTHEQKELLVYWDKLNTLITLLEDIIGQVNVIEFLIDSIRFPIQLSSKSLITEIRTEYEKLNGDIKKLVSNENILVRAEMNLLHLESLPREMTILEVLDLTVNRQAIVQGIITGISYNQQFNNSEIYISDSTGSLLLFRVPNGSDLGIGDEIKILGIRNSFAGYPQLTFSSSTTYEVLSSANNVDPIEMTDADDFTTMVGKFVYVTGTLAAKPNITTTSSNSSIIVNVGTKTVNVFIYASADYLNGAERVALVNKLNAMNAGETITVIGPVRWSGGAQVIAYNETNVLMGSYTVLTALEKAQAVANAITLPSEIQSDITLTLPTTGNYFSTITWESSDDAVIDAATGDVIVTLNVVSTVTLTAHVTVDSVTYSKNFIIEVGEIVHDISSARTMSNGDTVTVEGIVSAGTIGPSSANFFVQDDTGGINVFISSPTLDQQADIVVGNRIKITGTISFYNNQIQISSVTRLTYISSGTLVTPAVLTNLDELINYEGELVTMSAYLKVNGGIRDTVLIDLTDELSAFFNTNGDQIILSGINAGTLVTFTAPVGRRLTNVQLIVYSQDAVVIGSMGDNANLDVIAVNDLNLPSDGTEITTNITLPTTALFNRTISWVSSNPSVISNLGGVSRPENGDGNASVTLTGTFTRPDLTQFNIDVNLVVLEKEAFAGETTYVQDFSFLTTSTTTYSTSVTHTDTNGFSWSMLGRQEIGGWMLGNAADGSYVQVSATGGISSFSIDAVRAFTNTNARSFNVEVNGTVIGSFSVSTSSNTAQTFTLSNINVSGDVIIRVISTSPGSRGAFTVDDFTWTTFTP